MSDSSGRWSGFVTWNVFPIPMAEDASGATCVMPLTVTSYIRKGVKPQFWAARSSYQLCQAKSSVKVAAGRKTVNTQTSDTKCFSSVFLNWMFFPRLFWELAGLLPLLSCVAVHKQSFLQKPWMPFSAAPFHLTAGMISQGSRRLCHLAAGMIVLSCYFGRLQEVGPSEELSVSGQTINISISALTLFLVMSCQHSWGGAALPQKESHFVSSTAPCVTALLGLSWDKKEHPNFVCLLIIIFFFNLAAAQNWALWLKCCIWALFQGIAWMSSSRWINALA